MQTYLKVYRELLQGADLDPKYAQTVGIAVDHRRTNKSEESLKSNIARLVDYKARLVILKKGQKSLDVPQLAGDIAPSSTKATALSFIGSVELDALKEVKAYGALRGARNDARMKGIREKQAKAGKDEKKPAAAAATAGDD